MQMSSISARPVLKASPTTLFRPSSVFPSIKPSQSFIGACLSSERLPILSSTQCNASSTPLTSEGANTTFTEIFKSRSPVKNWNDVLRETEKEDPVVPVSRLIKERIESIRSMLGSMDDGEITISAYDTAWVALVEDMNGNNGPQFPSSLEWIANNQLPDGSWGDEVIFSAHDRILNTLACVIALKFWNVHPHKCQQGLEFLRENIEKLGGEKAEHMPIGFEVAFPSLLEIARKLEIDGFPEDSPVLQEIYARRNLKLTRIPQDIMHSMPTTLLHSLEGMPGLDWEKLLKLQCNDGSFLFSPSSTAFALMQTKDHNCLTYLTKAVQKFGGGVPNVYPVDLFEHIFAVDRLQRLGISRYFKSEIKECMDYVSRYFTDSGICWARNSPVHDVDDTAMAFRLLRLHGYNVSQDVFKHFEKNGEFFAFVGQSNHAVTGNYNLYRASQLMFPGEEILAQAKKFSSNFLIEKRSNNELFDKWIIMKDLPGEVGYALDMPWYASLPRLETRFYLEQYGAGDDVWIGKTLYRMNKVNNNTYLELAKMDYNNTQALYQSEWKSIQKWYSECELANFGMTKASLLLAYYCSTASIFEPERSQERLAWAKTSILIETIMSYCSTTKQTTREDKMALVHRFQQGITRGYYTNDRNQTGHAKIVQILFKTLNQLSMDSLLDHGRVISKHLRHAWSKWLIQWAGGDEQCGQEEAELLVRTLNLCSGRWVSSEELLLSNPKYVKLFEISNKICHQLRLLRYNKGQAKENGNANVYGISSGIDLEMQQLVKLVLSESSDDLDADIKQTFLAVVKSFYYTAYCNPEIIDNHIAKVLFDKVF